MSKGSNYLGFFFQGGNPLAMNENILQYPGHLGLVNDILCKDGVERELQIVQADSVMATAPREGALAYWVNETLKIVTTNLSLTGRGRAIGIFSCVVNLGYYTAIVRKGAQTNVWFVDAPTAAPTDDGLLVIPSATDGRADCLAAGSAATYSPIGRTVGTQDVTTNLALCDVDVFGMNV